MLAVRAITMINIAVLVILLCAALGRSSTSALRVFG